MLLTAIALSAGSSKHVAGQSFPTATTRVSSLTAAESGGVVTITGVMKYRNSSGTFLPLTGVRVDFYWWQSTGSSTNYIGQTYSSDSDGNFYYTWVDGLEPGQYYVNATYTGGDTFNGYYLTASQWTTPLLISLSLNINLDNPTLSVAQGGSATVTVTVTATNSNNAHPIILSATTAGQLFSTMTFSSSSGSTPLTSKLTLSVLNVTAPGTYVITITATSQEDNLPAVTASAALQILVQQNTRTVTVNVFGLPLNVQTSLYLGGSFVENLGSGTVTLTISNYTSLISVSKELDSGDTRYSCSQYSQSSTDTSVTTFTFSYSTEYKLTITAQLPQSIVVSKLVLIVNGTDESQDNFRAGQGFSGYFPQNSVVEFAIDPSYIATDVVDYNLSAWQDLTTKNLLNTSNVTSSGLYEITLTRPYYVMACYDELAIVTIKTNLPSDVSTKLQIGMAGSTKTTINIKGSSPYFTEPFLVGSTFECDVPPDQLVIYNSAGDTRYEFQGMAPLSPMTLERDTTIQLNFTVQYRVVVLSRFPAVTIQPADGVGWYVPGDLATIQVESNANDPYGVPYVFDGWSGAISANETKVSFPVTTPIAVNAQWAPNWMYLATVGLVTVCVTVPSSILARKKFRSWRSNGGKKPKSASKKSVGIGKHVKGKGEGDLKLYNYIIENRGSIKINDAMNELGMTREEVTQAVRRLKENHKLG